MEFKDIIFGLDIWSDAGGVLFGEIKNVGANFIAPAVSLICLIIAFAFIPSCITLHKNGGGRPFYEKIGVVIACVVIAVASGSLWVIFASYMP